MYLGFAMMLLSTQIYAQSSDSTSRIDWCKEEKNRARALISKDTFDLPESLLIEEFGMNSGDTYSQLLILEFHLYQRSYGCVRFGGECYDEEMFTAVENKYGKGFFAQQKTIADSLDALGLGYKEASYIEGEDALKKLLNRELKFEETKMYVAWFIINEQGYASEVHIEIADEMGGPMIQTHKDEIRNAKAVKYFNNRKCWTPGYLRGKALSGEEVILVIYPKEFK